MDSRPLSSPLHCRNLSIVDVEMRRLICLLLQANVALSVCLQPSAPRGVLESEVRLQLRFEAAQLPGRQTSAQSQQREPIDRLQCGDVRE